jgi:hypothetical protein
VVLLMQFGCLGRVMFRMHFMAVGGQRVMCRLLVMACIVMLGRFAQMPRRMFMMIRGLAMVFADFFHLKTPTCMNFDLPNLQHGA